MIISFGFTFKPPQNVNFELVGKVFTRDSKISLSNINVSIWQNGEIISRTKTNKLGEYKIQLAKIGNFNLMAGNQSHYFHPKKIKGFSIISMSSYQQDFELIIDKQVLQHETARLREMYNHMEKNPNNFSYKKEYFKRFPNTANELELFFNSRVPETNLKTYARVYFNKFFKCDMIGAASYMKKFIEFGMVTDMKNADTWTQKYYRSVSLIIIENPDELFRAAQLYKRKELKKFFKFLISGKSFGKKKPKNYFKHLKDKYPMIHAIWINSFKEYLEEKK